MRNAPDGPVETEAGAISCQGLWKVFGPKPGEFLQAMRRGNGEPEASTHTVAVRDLSFEVEAGEKFVVMGLSGSGKSSLVRCLTRLVEPTDGTVLFDGRDVTRMSEKELREVRRHECAMVFQHFGLLNHKSVLGNAAYGLEVRGVDRRAREARAREVLDVVGLAGWEHRSPQELSGGMKQRVGLARALAVDPRILFLDEPFSALDPLIRRELQDELLRLAATLDKTMVFITHDMSEALKIGDRIAILRQGSLVQVGTPEDILLRPADGYVSRFTEDTSRSRFVRAEAVAGRALVLPCETTVHEARQAIDKAGRDHVVTVDPAGRPQAAVSREELVNGRDDGRTLKQAASPARSIDSKRSLQEVAQLVANGPGPVMVITSDGRVLGVVETGLLVKALADFPTSLAEEDADVPRGQEPVAAASSPPH